MGQRGSALVAVIILIINAIVVYFGRIYYPANFVTDGLGKPVSFFENYWVLAAGEIVVGLIICFCLAIIYFIGAELWEDLQWIYYKFKK